MQRLVTETAVVQSAVATSWEQGFTSNFWLTPEAALDDWRVEIRFNGEISEIWNAQILSQDGDVYVIGALDYNGSLAAGATLAFGFTATGAEEDLTILDVNGAVGEPPQDDDAGPSLPLVLLDAATLSPDGTSLTIDLSLAGIAEEDVYVAYRVDAGDGGEQSGEVVIPAGGASIDATVALTEIDAAAAENGLAVSLEAAQNADIAESAREADIVVEEPAPSVAGIEVSAPTTFEAGPPASSGLLPDGPLSTAGSEIVDADGTPVKLRAVNWFGSETETFAPHGLWQRDLESMMNQMVAEGFNTIRLPYSVQAALENPVVNSVDANPELEGLTALEVIDLVVDYAEEIGMKIILDSHRTYAGAGANKSGLWYEGAFTEEDWLEAWRIMSERYGDSPAVIGADLHNEPHSGATWGGGGATDWAAAAERGGAVVQDIAPHWLIIVEGVGEYDGETYWWGGNLKGVADRPIELDVPNKLVYSPHDYPASVSPQTWFYDGSSLHEVFREHWGYIYEQDIAPIFVGEFGSRFEWEEDFAWADAIIGYFQGDFNGDDAIDLAQGDLGPSFAWWAWNPNSGDTGGYLEDDWITERYSAVDILEPLLGDYAAEPLSGGATYPARLSFELSLDTPPDETTVFQFRTEDGDAVAGEDYAPRFGSVVFEPGQQFATVYVEVLEDDVLERDETIVLVVSDGEGGEVRATGTIRDGAWTEDPDAIETFLRSTAVRSEASQRLEDARSMLDAAQAQTMTAAEGASLAPILGDGGVVEQFGDFIFN